MRSEHQQRIDEFMVKAGQMVPFARTQPDEATRILRAKLILEEAFETIIKGLGVAMVFPMDWRWDPKPVEFRIDGPFKKFGPGHSIRADGKLVKPPGHKPPDIAAELARQGA